MSRGSAAPDLLRTFANLFGAFGNRSLSLDPRSAARLGALEGTSVRFDVIGPGTEAPTPLRLEITGGEIVLGADHDAAPNAIVRGTAPALFGWLLASAGSRAPAGVTFEGDENLLRQIAALVKDFRPDLEAPLDRLLGREAARDLLGAAETTANLLRSAIEGLGRRTAGFCTFDRPRWIRRATGHAEYARRARRAPAAARSTRRTGAEDRATDRRRA